METRFKKHKIPMGLFALLILAGSVLFLGAAAVGEAVVGGVLIGVAVIAAAVVCWKMGQRGFYAEWEFQMPVVHPEGCRCLECLPGVPAWSPSGRLPVPGMPGGRESTGPDRL